MSTRNRSRAAPGSHVTQMFGRDMRYMVAYALQLVSSVFLTPLLTRALGLAGFGIFSADLALVYVLVWIACAGLNVGIARVYAAANGPERSRELLATALVLSGILTAAAYSTGRFWCAALGFSKFGASQRLAVVWSGLYAATLVSLAVVRCRDRLLPFAATSLLQSVGALGAGIAVAQIHQRSATDVVAGATGMQAIALFVSLAAVRPRWRGLRDFGLIRAALGFSLPLVPQQLGYFVITGADRFIVQRDLGAGSTARYQVAYNVGGMAITLLTFLNEAWMPRVFAIKDLAARQRVLKDSRDGLYRLLIPVSLGLALGGPIALRVWAPPSFDTDKITMVMLIVVLSTLGWCASLASMRVLLAAGRSSAAAVATLTAAGVNVALNLLLVPTLGINGSALATLASYVALAIGMGLFSRRSLALPQPPPRLWVKLAVSSGAVLASWYIPLHHLGIVGRIVGSLVCIGGAVVVLHGLVTTPSPTSVPVASVPIESPQRS